jgi:hypothetical protein
MHEFSILCISQGISSSSQIYSTKLAKFLFRKSWWGTSKWKLTYSRFVKIKMFFFLQLDILEKFRSLSLGCTYDDVRHSGPHFIQFVIFLNYKGLPRYLILFSGTNEKQYFHFRICFNRHLKVLILMKEKENCFICQIRLSWNQVLKQLNKNADTMQYQLSEFWNAYIPSRWSH